MGRWWWKLRANSVRNGTHTSTLGNWQNACDKNSETYLHRGGPRHSHWDSEETDRGAWVLMVVVVVTASELLLGKSFSFSGFLCGRNIREKFPSSLSSSSPVSIPGCREGEQALVPCQLLVGWRGNWKTRIGGVLTPPTNFPPMRTGTGDRDPRDLLIELHIIIKWGEEFLGREKD